MTNTDQTLNNFETELRTLSQLSLDDFRSKLLFKKGVNELSHNLKLLSKVTEKLANDVVTESINFIRKNKIRDNFTINRIVRLNHKYIGRFKNAISLSGS